MSPQVPGLFYSTKLQASLAWWKQPLNFASKEVVRYIENRSVLFPSALATIAEGSSPTKSRDTGELLSQKLSLSSTRNLIDSLTFLSLSSVVHACIIILPLSCDFGLPFEWILWSNSTHFSRVSSNFLVNCIESAVNAARFDNEPAVLSFSRFAVYVNPFYWNAALSFE